MSQLPALWSGLITSVVTLLALIATTLRRPGFLATADRIVWARMTVSIVREQRRMAALPLPPGTELRHSVDGGPRLVVRSGADQRQLSKESGE